MGKVIGKNKAKLMFSLVKKVGERKREEIWRHVLGGWVMENL